MSFPKTIPKLTSHQIEIRNDFMQFWHEKILTDKLSFVDGFNKKFLDKFPITKPTTTLEIGAGIGTHIYDEDLTNQDYHALELRKNMITVLNQNHNNVLDQNHKTVKSIMGDAQNLPIKNDYFDRILTIHILEHLPDLPSAISEIHRVIKKTPDAWYYAVFPVEGGLAYNMGRFFTSERIFRKRYKMPYRWLIESEHINSADEIITELRKKFIILYREFYPFNIPIQNLNFFIGMVMKAK